MSLNMNVPKLRFNEFNQKLVRIKLKEIITSNTYGPRFNANDYHQNGNVRTIRGTDVSVDGNIKYDQVPLAKLDNNFIENHLLKDGDLIMITTADCGLTGMFKEQSIKYIPSAYAVRIRLDNYGYPLYFKYFFQTTLAKNEINKYIRKATVANLPASDIGRIRISLPSKQEQEKIASFLSAVDTKLEQLTAKTKLLQEYKKGVMQKIFSQEIRFRDDDGSDYPEWVENKLGNIATFFNSKRIPLTESDRKNGIYPYYGASGIIDYVNDYIFDGEYILLGEDGANITMRNSRLVFLANGKFWVNNHAHIFQAKKSNSFLCEALERIKYDKYNTGTAQPKLNSDVVKKIRISLPSLKEQTKIANFLTSIDSKISQTQTQLNATKEFKKALLQQMFV